MPPEYNSGFRSQAPTSSGTPSCTRDVAQRRALRLAISLGSFDRPPALPDPAARVQLGVPFASADLTGNPELHSGRRAATGLRFAINSAWVNQLQASPGLAARVQLGVPLASADLTGNPELHSGRRAATCLSACDQLCLSQPTQGVTRPRCPSTTRVSGRKRRLPRPGTPSCTRAGAQRRVLRLATDLRQLSRPPASPGAVARVQLGVPFASAGSTGTPLLPSGDLRFPDESSLLDKQSRQIWRYRATSRPECGAIPFTGASLWRDSRNRGGMPIEYEPIRRLSTPLVDTADLDAFLAMATNELYQLHEGSLARYRLRPSEFQRWLAERGGPRNPQ